MVLRLADGDDRSVDGLWAEARHRLGQVVRGHDEADARDGERGARVDPDDARPGDGQRDELRVELVREVDVGDVSLPAGDAVGPADALGR